MDYKKKDVPQDIENALKIDKAKVFAQVRALGAGVKFTQLEYRQILASVAQLLSIGEAINEEEANKLLDMAQNLFQHQSVSLRQLLHWLLREMYNLLYNLPDNLPESVKTRYKSVKNRYHLSFPSEASKDATLRDAKGTNESIVIPNAVRALCRLYEPANAQVFAKAIHALIVNREQPSIQSAALVSLYHTLPWGISHLQPVQGEIQTAFTETRSSGSWAWGQYHALGLDYHTRRGSEMLARDFIQSGDRVPKRSGKLQSPAAKIFFARFAGVLSEKGDYRQGSIKFLKEQLDSFESIEYDPTVTGDKEGFVLKRSMVALEAAKTICQIENVDRESLDQAVQKLVEMANNSHQVVKFAAMRTLSSVANTSPDMVRRHNDTIRKQMKSSNKDIGGFATTTLLKTADEADVDSLMKEVGSLMTNASNDFKVVIVEAVTALCLKFPSKEEALAKFLGDYLKDEGSYEFKRAMVEGLFDLVKSIPETKKNVLHQLCEFIEDCEYPSLTIRVLHVIGNEGPTVDHPTSHIRYIYNRLVLENALVRAAAVTALSKFGVGQKDAELKRSVRVLLSRSLDDEDDEVRDRAALSLRLMDGEDESSRELIRNDSMFSLLEFEDRLALYVSSDDRSTFNEPFDLSEVPIVSREKALSGARTKKLLDSTTPKPPAASKRSGRKGADDLAPSAAATQKKYMQELQAIPEIAAYGKLLTSSPAIEIYNADFVLTLVKHIFNEHVVFQFNVSTDLENDVLDDIRVDFDSKNEFYEEEWSFPCSGVSKEQPGIAYSGFKKTDRAGRYLPKPVGFPSVVHLTIKDTNSPDEPGMSLEEELDLFSLEFADFFMPAFAGSFNSVWEQLLPKRDKEDEADMILPQVTSVQEAVKKILNDIHLQPLEGTENVSSKYQHELKLYGKTVYGSRVAAIVKIVRLVDQGNTIGVSVAARAEEDGVAAMFVKSFE